MVHELRSPLKYVGGKFVSAQRIVSAFPEPDQYQTYNEPCGGAAHVLIAKPNWGHREVLNDLNGDLMNFWRQLADHADELVAQLQARPYSRELYYEAYLKLFDGSKLDPMTRAVYWFYCLRNSATGWIRKTPTGWNNTLGSAQAYYAALDYFLPVQKRITQPRVILDDRDVERVVEEYDSPKTLHYIDPPYIGAEYYYQVGWKRWGKKPFHHERLAALLNEVKGYVALSYYPDPQLDIWYPPDRWRRITWQQHKPTALSESARPDMRTATELLLCNYEEPGLWAGQPGEYECGSEE
jgi:DNA adenine methylase